MKDINLVLIDFGGVIAHEGFKQGIKDLAVEHGYDVEELKKIGFDLVYDSGFTRGKTDADGFWNEFKKITGINESNKNLTEIILKRFVVRPEMIDFVQKVKAKGINIAILSDQTNWIDELDEKYDFFKYFDLVMNSYRLGITKKEPEIFDIALEKMHGTPESTLFIDDHGPHIRRACEKGINTILFKDLEDFREKIKEFFDDISF